MLCAPLSLWAVLLRVVLRSCPSFVFSSLFLGGAALPSSSSCGVLQLSSAGAAWLPLRLGGAVFLFLLGVVLLSPDLSVVLCCLTLPLWSVPAVLFFFSVELHI